MKQKAIVMATAFSMLLAVGATGVGSETLHQHPAYARQNVQIQTQQTPMFALSETEVLLLAPPTCEEK